MFYLSKDICFGSHGQLETKELQGKLSNIHGLRQAATQRGAKPRVMESQSDRVIQVEHKSEKWLVPGCVMKCQSLVRQALQALQASSYVSNVILEVIEFQD